MTDIFFGKDHVLLKVDYDDPEPHRHWAKHLIFSLGGTFDCHMETQNFPCEGIVISSNVPHIINSGQSTMLAFLFDETSQVAQKMEQVYLTDRNYALLDEDTVFALRKIWLNGMEDSYDVDTMKACYPAVHKDILTVCGLYTQAPTATATAIAMDSRIVQVLERVKAMTEIPEDTIPRLADTLFLSQSRLSHLFKEQTGVSFSSFLVLRKIQIAYQSLLSGDSITDAALNAGFASSSHFATVNKNMFGISANHFHKDTRLILV